MTVVGEFFRVDVETHDAAVFDRQPQIAGAIFGDRPDVIARQAVACAALMREMTQGEPIVPIESVLSGDPQETA